MGLKDKLASGSFSILAEMRPPKGVDTNGFAAQAQKLTGLVDAFMIPDQRDSQLAMSSWGASALLKSKNIPAIMQLSLRDRNRLALQGDLLAAHVMGVDAVCVHRGQEINTTDHPGAREVYDLNPVQALKAITRLNQGRDFMENPIEGATAFFAGSTFRLWTAGRLGGLEEEVDRLSEAGAEFLITPPVFDPENLLAVKEKLADRDLTILPTVVVRNGCRRRHRRHAVGPGPGQFRLPCSAGP
jgi:methylenetetrahydrofolate reductase (NADPH)